MKANSGKWIVLLLALFCFVQAVSAFDVKTETVDPSSGALEPGQQVSARYVLTYDMITSDLSDETFELSTGLQNPSWDITVYHDGVGTPIKKAGYYPVLLEFEIDYGQGDTELDIKVRGTVPSSASGTILVTKIEHLRDKDVKDTHSVTRDVVSAGQVEDSLSAQQQRLKDLKADMDGKAGEGVDVSAAQTKYNAASQALTSAAAASPSQAAGYITTATKNIDEAKSLLDRAWAEKEVSNAAATIESLDGMITYFVENRSMASDPQVVAIMTKRESSVQFYSQAKDALNANNYSLARSKAADGLNKANEALTDANALREKLGEGFSLGGNLLLYIGIGVVIILIVVGVVIYRKRTGWDELG
ncbi:MULTISPECIES: hypothetical protein [unclassified Methanoculleus]|jgi:hypothetical protein|uniref:Uncharacterized protein n=1 Tax=Methanoculleus palmolei TaxID=72612 RepID=A0ABD8A8E9_9EURY|nr:hypothetical protein [Methanoculleus sp. UBA377]WOX55430.1 hypothetical protein R6Y95_08140 [Methanoculleus palmolei]